MDFESRSPSAAALAEVPDLEAARVDRDIAAAPMEFSADWDLTGFISFEGIFPSSLFASCFSLRLY